MGGLRYVGMAIGKAEVHGRAESYMWVGLRYMGRRGGGAEGH